MEDGFAQGYAVGRDSNGGNGSMGGYGAWGDWIWIIVLFALWQNGGFGGFGGNGGSGYEGALQRGFDNQSVINKLNGLENGLCDGFYSVNTAFGTLNTNLCNQFSNVTNAITTSGYETRSAISDLGYRLQDCCCQTQRAIDGVNYNMATNTCAITNSISNSTRDIIENQNANGRAILDFLTKDKISSLTAENQALKFQASQSAQNAFITANQEAQTAELIRRLGRDCPVPAYVVPNPNCCYNAQVSYSNGCGCGCN